MKKLALLLALMLLALPCCAMADDADMTATGEAATVREMVRGDSGDDVKALMQRLADLGYYTSKVDSQFGPGMARAVKAFNAQCGLGDSETATAAMQELVFAENAPIKTAMPPVIKAVALEEYEGKPVFSVTAYNPQESDIVFLSVIFRCYDAEGERIYSVPAESASIGTENRFGKYHDIEIACGQESDLRSVQAFDLSAYPGVARVEASLYCYQAGNKVVVVPEGSFGWVSSDGTGASVSATEDAIQMFNRTAEQDGLAQNFTLSAEVRQMYAMDSEYYGLPAGLYVAQVLEDGVLAAAGIQAGDVITSIAGVSLDFEEALYIVKAQMQEGVSYAMEYVRGGEKAQTTICWGEPAGEQDAE